MLNCNKNMSRTIYTIQYLKSQFENTHDDIHFQVMLLMVQNWHYWVQNEAKKHESDLSPTLNLRTITTNTARKMFLSHVPPVPLFLLRFFLFFFSFYSTFYVAWIVKHVVLKIVMKLFKEKYQYIWTLWTFRLTRNTTW